jgi:hypothetical protein
MAQAERIHGRPLNAKTLGTAAAPPTFSAPPSRASWPPPKPTRDDRGRKHIQPQPSSVSFDENAGGTDPQTSQRGGSSLGQQDQQFDRELAAVRAGARPATPDRTLGVGIRQEMEWPISSDRVPALWPLSSAPAQAPVVADKDAQRLQKRVSKLEDTLVQKLVARTPSGPDGEGALRTLTKAFVHYDTAQDGVVEQGEFTRVLAKFGIVASLPPSDAMRPLVAALFAKHARGSELDYRRFAENLLCDKGIRVPQALAAVREQQENASAWQYRTAVQQALSRRNLEPSEPVAAHQMHPTFREAWVERSTASRAVEEDLMYRPGPLKEADGAAMRGRLPAGRLGYAEYLKREEARREAEARHRREYSDEAHAGMKAMQNYEADRAAHSLASWRQQQQELERLGGLTLGEYEAATMRRRAR